MKLPNLPKVEIGSALRLYNAPPLLEEAIKRVLTYENPAAITAERYSPWGAGRIDPEVRMFRTMLDHLEIPRGFSPDTMQPEFVTMWRRLPRRDYRTSFPVEFPKQLLKANDEQKRIVRAFKTAETKGSRPNGTYLFVAPTSAGKSIAIALLAAYLGERTLVLCKTNLIKRAWQEDMYKLFGMNENDLGIIQQAKYRLGKHITLASIATLSKRKHLWAEIFSKVGCLIVDECQILSSATVKEVAENCPSKYLIGMTATPTRRDGMHFVLNAHLGKPVLTILNKQEETEHSFPLGDVQTVLTAFEFNDSETGKAVEADELDFHALTAAMMNDEKRNALIVATAKKDWDAGHCVLITTPRVEHVEMLVKLLQEAGVEDANSLTGEDNIRKAYAEKLIEMVFNRTCRCLVATTQLIKLGANLNPLDRLHCAIPPMNAQDLEQLVGRIRRKYPGKQDCKMTWYRDHLQPYLDRKYRRVAVPVFKKLKVPRFENVWTT